MIRVPVPHEVHPEWVPQADLTEPAGAGGLADVGRNRYLLRLLVIKELRARYSASALGMVWSYIMPLSRFAMYYFVIGIVLGLHRDVPNFPLHLFAGLVFVSLFTETFASGTRSIVKNRAIVNKMAMPREMFPISAVIVSLIHAFPQALIMFTVALLLGWSPSWEAILAATLGLSMLALFGAGLALLFSGLNVFFRDFGQVVALLSMFTHWAVPMIYPYTKISEGELGGTWAEQVYLLNPLAEAVLLLQKAFWAPTCLGDAECDGPNAFPEYLFTRGFIMLAVGIVFLYVCQKVFTRLENKFAERL